MQYKKNLCVYNPSTKLRIFPIKELNKYECLIQTTVRIV